MIIFEKIMFDIPLCIVIILTLPIERYKDTLALILTISLTLYLEQYSSRIVT